MKVALFILGAIFLIPSSDSAFAQTERSSGVKGSVTDLLGVPIPGARTSIAEESGKNEKTTTSDKEGKDELAGLSNGKAAIGFHHDGFYEESESIYLNRNHREL